ncbi:MAG: Tar ligand binding domain-containing protein, partial [Betaproteobacteria bacterium]|nr:Tar ligand binding domain-containing protein [Betaproteobacteria bacterium]
MENKDLVAIWAGLSISESTNSNILGTDMLNSFKVGSRLFVLTAFASVITVIVLLFGLSGMKKMSVNTDIIYNEGAVSLPQLAKVDVTLNALVGDVFRSFQHDPSSAAAKVHANHSVAEHLSKAEERVKEIEEAWANYIATPLSDEEKALASKFTEDYARFVKEVVRPTLSSLAANDYSSDVLERFISGYRDLGVSLEKTARDLVKINNKLAKANFEKTMEAYNSSLVYMTIASITGLLLSILIAWKIIRSIVIPLSSLQTAMGEIEQSGD